MAPEPNPYGDRLASIFLFRTTLRVAFDGPAQGTPLGESCHRAILLICSSPNQLVMRSLVAAVTFPLELHAVRASRGHCSGLTPRYRPAPSGLTARTACDPWKT